MHAEIQDKRVRRTQHLLAKALIALTLEKGYETVTIRDITTRADVGYATFFRHYHAKDELLQDVLDVVLNELIELLRSPAIATDPRTTGIMLFRYVEQHSEVVRVLLGSHALRQRLLKLSTESTAHSSRPLPESPVPFEIATYHIAASTVMLIEYWLEQQFPYPVEKMGEIYETLIATPTSRLAFR